MNNNGRIFREPRKKNKHLKSGVLETDKYKRCLQINCPYYREGGCQPCEECGTESYVLKKECYRCMSCANISNNKRWTDSKEDKRMKSTRDIIKAITEGCTRRSSESKVMHIPDSGLIDIDFG